MDEKLKQREPYEAPAVLDITPVTIVNVKGENSQEPEVYGDPE